MKFFHLLPVFAITLLSGCHSSPDSNQILEDLQENLDFGNLTTVSRIADSLQKVKGEDKYVLHITDSLNQIASRIRHDFSLGQAQIDQKLQQFKINLQGQEKVNFEKKGWLECRIIDGEKKYFNRAASNLLLLEKFYGLIPDNRVADPVTSFRMDHLRKVLLASGTKSDPVVPVKMKVKYTITVDADAVPDGKIIRCWMPWPKLKPRQKDVTMISTSQPGYELSPDTAIHSALYLEKPARKGTPSIFQEEFIYTSYAQHFNLRESGVFPYNRNSDSYLRYTSEQLPHICFSDRVKRLADSIAGDDTNPVSVTDMIYSWFKKNIPWAGALEYSIMPNIPEYVIQNMRGDCGMQTFLFISMLRYRGIPARWQSGWMMPPSNENLHDWSEVYFEGPGWVPVDVTYDLLPSTDNSLKYYYMSGIDAYRMIINDGIAGPLHPEKKFLRSEPYDFQRGEVEWEGGNLYFDKWDYNIEIEYLN